MIRRIGLIALAVTAAAGLNSAIVAQSAGPQPAAMPPPIVAPKDTPYPGVIRVDVDATDVERRIFKVHETIPVRPGAALVLLYPQWLPGNHGPTGRVDKLAGLTIRASGTRGALDAGSRRCVRVSRGRAAGAHRRSRSTSSSRPPSNAAKGAW